MISDFNWPSPRTVFVGAMTILSTAFGGLVAARRLYNQADIVADVAKISVIIALGTLVISFTIWTLTHIKKTRKKPRGIRGVLAGGLTALAIIPLPVFSWAYKQELLNRLDSGQDGAIVVFLKSILPALETGLMSFITFPKPAIVAFIASLCLGGIVARFIPVQPAENHSPLR